MFGKKGDTGAGGKKIDTVIGKDTEVTGKLVASGAVRVEGRLEGEILATSDVVVGETARIEAQVTARNVTIAGEVYGNIEASGRLEIVPTGRLIGDVRVAFLAVDDGAFFKGQCEMIREGDSGKQLASQMSQGPGDGRKAEE